MRISIFGSGYVGLVSGTCFSELGNHVVCYDVDRAKIERLRTGQLPIYEPGLEELVRSNLQAGRLTFTDDIAEAVRQPEIIFLAVGTPPGPDGSADLQYLFAAAKQIAAHIKKECVVATKSTVPVGTADALREIFRSESGQDGRIRVASNPEFLREGAAVKDFLNPERVVVGIDDPTLEPLFRTLYSTTTRAERPLIFMDVRSAELTKYAANAFLATKISFINEIARLCEKAGANVNKISYGMGFDSRIGSRFLHAGIGYGGSCFPKDVRALYHTAAEHGLEFSLLKEVDEINNRQKGLLFERLQHALPDLSGKTIAIWGLSFKPRTNDIRESAALTLIPLIQKAGATVQAYDPKAMEEARQVLPPETVFSASALEAATGADALLLVTEWDEFRTVDLQELKAALRGTLLLDGRNIYDRRLVSESGLQYIGIGTN